MQMQTRREFVKTMGRAALLRCSFMIWFFWGSIGCLFLLQPLKVHADGKYFPEKVYKVPPAIPSQRAILIYKAGIETLVLESELEGKGKEFGWVIPLPSKPTRFEEASPGLLKTLSFGIVPKITNDLTDLLGIISVISVITTLWFLFVLIKKPKKPLYALCLPLLIALFVGVFMPTFTTAGIEFGDMPGVKVEHIQEIGSYELAVLEAENADALDNWLKSNGFSGLTEKDKVITADYITDKWHFVTAKLRREAEGFSRPHPLAVSFASDKPIYPIRLTATTNSEVYLELFVIADQRATSRQLVLELADEYAFKTDAERDYQGDGFLAGFVGKTYLQNVGHPSAKKYMWDGCVLSKLCGTLQPRDMGRDIVLRLKTSAPYRKHYYSRRGAKQTGLIWGSITWCFLLILIVRGYYKRTKAEDTTRFALARAVAAASLGTLFVGAVASAALPKTQVEKMPGKGRPLYEVFVKQIDFLEKQAITKEYAYFSGMSKQAVAAEIRAYFGCKVSKNVYTGEKVKYEDSPGNYTIIEDERGIILTTYSDQGFPSDFILTSKPDEEPFDYEAVEQSFSGLLRPERDESQLSVLRRVVYCTPWHPHYHAILIRLFRQQPKELIPIILADLKNRVDNSLADDEEINAVEYEASMLGCITRTPPPLDVTDKVTMRKFLAKIEACKTREMDRRG